MSDKFKGVQTPGAPSERQPFNAPIAGVGRDLSMGAHIESPMCTLCAQGNTEHVHLSPHMYRESRTGALDLKPTFLYVTTIPAPSCDSCHIEMERHDDTHWRCGSEECPEQGKPIPAHLSGVYPAVLFDGSRR